MIKKQFDQCLQGGISRMLVHLNLLRYWAPGDHYSRVPHNTHGLKLTSDVLFPKHRALHMFMFLSEILGAQMW